MSLTAAHIIRRMSTKLFHAVARLSSSLRWCLSGTPIQNSLEDLAALITFIRVSPLDNLPDFRKYIISPLLNNTGVGKEGLRCLLDSVCLRRTKKLLRLPEEKYEFREVEFSAAERELYNTTAREIVEAIKQQVNQPKNTKTYFGIFQLWLRLRRICNHGSFQKPFSIAPAEIVQFDPEEALALLRQREDAKCTYCSAEVYQLHSMEEDGDGHFTICGYLICARCIPRYRKALRKDKDKKSFSCSLCRQHVTRSCLLTEKMMAEHSVGMKIPAEKYFQADGISSKVSTLVADIEQNGNDKKGYVKISQSTTISGKAGNDWQFYLELYSLAGRGL
jgi:SWI/SNF-related matrix-associated actin-dependent regulator of chromatin subfamily A3